VDEFLADRPEKMIALSCGAGFLVKGVSTSGRIASPVSGSNPGS